MMHDYDIWPFKPKGKPAAGSLFEMIAHAQHHGLKEFDYMQDGEKIKVKLDAISSRTTDMMYWG